MTLSLSEGFRIVDATKEKSRTLEWMMIREKINQTKGRYQECFRSPIGIKMARDSDTVITVLALIELECPFCFIPRKIHACDYGVSWLIREDGLLEKPTAFLQLAPLESRNKSTYPWTAIMPNIVDFRDKFGVTREDRVLFSTSFQFDPSIIELFLPAFTGSQLIIASEAVRSSSTAFLTLFAQTRPTIVQLTPAILTILGQTVLDQLFAEETSLRILMIGGAAFPLALLKPYIEKNKRVQVYNVYGITEISCWASIQQILPSTRFVTIGRPLIETSFHVSPNGELSIGGSRQCFVEGALTNGFTPTGDLVEEVADGMAIVGRTNDEFKFNDIRVNLASWAKNIVEQKQALAAEFIVFEKIFLVLFVVNAAPTLEANFPTVLRPAKIFHLDRLPVNENGKVDKDELQKMIVRDGGTIENREKHFWDTVAKYGITITSDLGISFRAYGIDSFAAAELSFEMNCPNLLAEILSDKTTIESFLRKLFSIEKQSKRNSDEKRVLKADLETKFRTDWAHDYGKCVDTDPKLVQIDDKDCVICGAYNGVVVALEVNSGREIWQATLPAGIDSTFGYSPDFVIIGCLNGNVYVFDICKDELHWTFPTNGPIHTEILVDESGCAYVFSNDETLYKLNVLEKTVAWTCKIGSSGPGTPLRTRFFEKLDNDYIDVFLVGTLDKRIVCVNQHTGVILWTTKLEGPVFAPMITTISNNIYVCTVNGIFYELDLKTGSKLFQYVLNGAVFAACHFVEELRLCIISTQEGSILFIRKTSVRFITVLRIQIDGASFIKTIFRSILDKSSKTLALWQIGTEGIIYTIETNWELDGENLSLYGEKVTSRAIGDGVTTTFTQPLCLSNDQETKLFVASRDDMLRGCELCDFVIKAAIARIERTKGSQDEGRKATYDFIKLFLVQLRSDLKAKDLGSGTVQWFAFWDTMQGAWEEQVDSFINDDRERAIMHSIWNEVADWMEEAVIDATRSSKNEDQ
ncbi:unnamed protein product, partial [Mesorhabditis belari]|uniref:Uncharacterized protein n=1 Tax=Mesorhabditis belari TaxID=2138241 RepID=A0AAF3E9S0_9BILA